MDSRVDANTCPKCGSSVGASADSCPQCGILFSKWQERENNVAAGNVGRYTISNATSSEFNWTILAIVALVVGSVFWFLEHQ
jgi:uncharacterized membrane protein YvbJ